MTDWAEMAARYGPLVWSTAYRLLGCEADAADCYQETFLSAVRVWRRGPIENWEALLRHLAVARAMDGLRRRVRERGRRDAWPAFGDPPTEEAGPGERAQASELAERLRDALADLPRRESEVFSLRCVEGLSYEQIAGRLGLRVNAVGVLLHRARERLRERLVPFVAGRKG